MSQGSCSIGSRPLGLLVCRVDESWGVGRQKRGARFSWNSNPLDPPQEDDDDDDDDDDEDEEEEEEEDADEGEDETVQPMDFDPLNPPPKKKIDFITHTPPFFDKINYWPQLRPQYLLKQRELQLGRPGFRRNDCEWR